jgi:hypothetical protein
LEDISFLFTAISNCTVRKFNPSRACFQMPSVTAYNFQE